MAGSYKLVAVLGLLAFCVGVARPANILGVFTSTSPSHLIIHMSYIRAMVERGHNATVITSLPIKDKNPKIHHILIPQSEQRTKEIADANERAKKPRNILQKIRDGLNSAFSNAPRQADPIKDQRFQDFMHNPDNKFDLIIMGYYFNNFHLGLAGHFKCPIVISFMTSTNLFLDRYIGNPPEVAYVPASPLVAAPNPLKFSGRLSNFMTNFIFRIFGFFLNWQEDNLYNEVFPPSKYPPFEEVKKKVSLVLCNSHFTDGFIRPNVPALVDVGGIQIKPKSNPLPEHLQKIFNASSEHGVIYLSFGSNIKSKDMNPQLYQIIFKALAGLKQTVLWKWDAVEKPGNAPNIFYESWLPQDDLLANPNVKLFITHAGKGGVTESQYHGVPMVAIPFYADQISNGAAVERDGFGVKIDQNTMTSETLKAAVMEVLENPKYVRKVKQFSSLYRDRPMHARDTAVYWLEYVLRHKGAYHMQSPLVHLSGFQYLSLDVIGFLLLVVFLVYKSITIPTKFVYRKIFAKKEPKIKEN
ncbi:UDP-glycosyltransferase UGT5-like [Episyrphus balteatus]|uniref:UDP-glycosyltransferase UGT5-like n=1 Tax=Episyrphus balteatus TaxID=286459 RepID=UPI002485FD4B|nr:UDP-glycosyltransferase UGT5-like [Episyrphus balteatus]